MITKPTHFPNLKRRLNYGAYRRHNEYKNEIRQDCLKRCVYCDIHENESGGEENMTLDHFRPKSIPEYKHLEHIPHNLLYACAPCNNLKGNDWPAYGTTETFIGRSGYLDPFAVNRLDYFEVDKDGSLIPQKDPAEYMIKILELNRPFIKYIRNKRESIYKSLSSLISHFETEIGGYKTLLAEVKQKDKIAIQQEIKKLTALQNLVYEIDKLLKLG